ncbi:MAG TPA: site-specific DNA-methyltransferase, partial [Anaerolineales bacterium]|nr:site-specific DNA-methyltransferase [Anaerolineales bacterium]
MTKTSKTSSFGTESRISHDSSSYYNSRLYAKLSSFGKEVAGKDNFFPQGLKDKIILASAENMEMIPKNSLHLMVTSPPYNVSKEYDKDLSLSEYLDMLHRVFSESYRVLVKGGRACINIANLGRKPYIPLSDYISPMMQEIGFLMRGEIIWHKGAGAGVSMAWGSWKSASNPVLRDVHEYILVFSKGSFKRGKGENSKSTIKKEDFMAWTKSVWEMKTESAKRVGHPAPFPVELPY